MTDSEPRREANALLDRFVLEGHPTDFWDLNRPPDDQPDRQRTLAEALDRIGVAAFNSGDTARARDAFLALLNFRLALVSAAPDDRRAIRDFASAADLLGIVALKMSNLKVAEEMLEEALKYRRGLFEDERTDAHAALLYGVALWHMARLERAKGNHDDERDWALRAEAHLTDVDAKWPNVSFITEELAEVRLRLTDFDRG